MFPYYYFVIATALAVLPISFLAKSAIDRVRANPADYEKIAQSFFIRVAIAEALPIIFVILGFINQAPAQSINELIGPGILNLIFILFGIIFILMQRFVGVTEDSRVKVNMITMVSLSLINSIPIISIVAFFLMLPQ